MHTDADAFNSDLTSGSNNPIWNPENTYDDGRVFPAVDSPIETEVLVVGGGVAGLVTAYRLAESGKQVVLVEDGFIGSGETGRSTAHITYVTDQRYSDLINMFGRETARQIFESHKWAIAWYHELVHNEHIHCEFREIQGHLFTHPSDTEDTLFEEFDALQEIGCDAELIDRVPFIRTDGWKRCIRYHGQAELHPLQFVAGLAQAVIRKGGKIFTQSKAENFSPQGADVNGFPVRAKHIVLAGNSIARGRFSFQAKQWPYRSCAVAIRIPKHSLPHAFWWDTGEKESVWINRPYHYVRVVKGGPDHDLLLVGGEDHRAGQSEKEAVSPEERYERLHAWAKKNFAHCGEIVSGWSGQILYAIDGLAFLGRNSGSENTYVITGDSGNGFTYAAIGGQIITDLICGRENPWAEIYDPARSVLKTAPKDYLHEIVGMIGEYADWLKPGDDRTIEELQPGEGAVLREGLKKVTVYRDENGKVHRCSAVCPHQGAIVRWNPDEQTFDCPLHGSRFTGTGKVVNGPGNTDLEEV